MPGQRIGSVIAAVFGLIYVLVNSGSLPSAWSVTLRVLAVLAFVAVLVAIFRADTPPADQKGQQWQGFSRAYWLVVAAEVVALFVGARVLSGPLNLPAAGVAWVSLVVGVHFFALAAIWRQPFFHWLGGVISCCGVVGLVLAFAGVEGPAIAVIAGVLPGAVLLGFGWWGAHRTAVPAEREKVAVL